MPFVDKQCKEGKNRLKEKKLILPITNLEVAEEANPKPGAVTIPIPSIEAKGETSLAPSKRATGKLSVPMPTIKGKGAVVKET